VAGSRYSDLLSFDTRLSELAHLGDVSRVKSPKTLGKGVRPVLDERHRRSLIKTIANAMIENLPAETERLLDSDVDFKDLGDAAIKILSDIMLGRALVLRLDSNATATQRSAITTFLETALRIPYSLDKDRQEASIAKLADVILPDEHASVRGLFSDDNLRLRDQFIAEIPVITSAEVGKNAGQKSGNAYATAARWKKNGSIFSINHRGTEYFPAFQFIDGRPNPAIKSILAALSKSFSPWQCAFWFVSTNGWLDDEAPADCLDNADAVIDAARKETQDVVG
jgi:hypothetical protein